MHKLTTTNLAAWMARLCALIIVLLPFHAFMTVWTSSLVGHYTLLRLWKEVLLVLLVVGALVLLARSAEVRRRFFGDRLVLLICIYLALLVVAGLVALLRGMVSHKALADGVLLDGRYLAFFLVTWLVTSQHDLLVRFWKRLVLIPAAVTVGFAALQYTVLPHDFLRHFGYGAATIPPTETVDQKAAYTRVQSTLRGANPFGAYLVVVIAALAPGVLKRRWTWVVGFVFSGLALFFTFSRSAWLGTLLALGYVLWLGLRTARTRQVVTLVAAVALLAFAAAAYGLRNNDRFQNVFLHTSSHPGSVRTSNENHASALREGLSDIVHQPFGGGPGTAGPASVYNKAPALIAENYYIQIGQELGVLGFGLFVAINALAVRRLWRGRDSQLSLVLLASFIGLIAVNMLSHAWTDDTLAYIWWGLAGAALAVPKGQASAAPPPATKKK